MRLVQAMRRSVLHLLIIAAAIYLYWLAGTWDFVAPRGRLGPDIWPKAILIMLIAVCAFAVIRNVIFARRPGTDAGTLEEIVRVTRAAGADEPAEAAGLTWPRLVLAGAALFVAYVLVLDYLGFFVATVLLMASFMLVGRWRNIPGVVATSLIGGLAFFYVFRGVVYVSLPLGQGPFQSVSLFLTQVLQMR